MFKKRRRQIVFVCSSVVNSELISEIIPANSVGEASKLFEEKFSTIPKSILGPFYKKRSAVLETKTPVKFDGKPIKANYNGWLVNAFPLKDPEDSAFLIFIKQIDDKQKQIAPKGTVIVPLTDLRLI